MATALETQQRDILALSLATNPFFQPNPIPTQDNSLKTSSKKITGAINEVLNACKTNEQSIINVGTTVKSDIDKQNQNIAVTNQNLLNVTRTLSEAQNSIVELKKDDTQLEGQMTLLNEQTNVNKAQIEALGETTQTNTQSIATLRNDLDTHIENAGAEGGGTGGGTVLPKGVKVYRKKVYGGGGTTNQGHIVPLTGWPTDIYYKDENFKICYLKEVKETLLLPLTDFVNPTDNAKYTLGAIAESNGLLVYNGTSKRYETVLGNTTPFLLKSKVPMQWSGYYDELTDFGKGSLLASGTYCYVAWSTDQVTWYGNQQKEVDITNFADIKAKCGTYSETYVHRWLWEGKPVYFAVAFIPYDATKISGFGYIGYGSNASITNYIPVKLAGRYYSDNSGIRYYYYLGQRMDGTPYVHLANISEGLYMAEYWDAGDTKIII